jgi:NAD(P)H dehydrogenase (quinone)
MFEYRILTQATGRISTMALVTVAYHSGYGHTKKVADYILEGLNSVEGVTAHLLNVEEVDNSSGDYASGWDLLAASDGIIFGSPTYMGGASGPFKVFADKTSKVWFSLGWKDKLAGGFSNSLALSGDKLSTLQYFSILAAQHGMVWVGTGLMPGNNDINAINRIGSSLGLMTQADNVPPEESPIGGDLETAKLFGARFAGAVKRWNGQA